VGERAEVGEEVGAETGDQEARAEEEVGAGLKEEDAEAGEGTEARPEGGDL